MKLPLVQFRNATIIQNNQTILSDVNIEVEQGEFVFLIGKTGTGKSSLIKTLYADLPLQGRHSSSIGFQSWENKAKRNSFFKKEAGCSVSRF